MTDEEREDFRRVIEARDRDPRPDVPADEVYGRALVKIENIRKAQQTSQAARRLHWTPAQVRGDDGVGG